MATQRLLSSQPSTALPSPLRFLFTTLPSAYAEMQEPGSVEKYKRIKEGGQTIALTDAILRKHLTGAITIACALEDSNGMARVAVADVDHGGADAVHRVQREAIACGYPAFSFISKGAGDHDGGYVWIVFDSSYEAIRLRALIANICQAVGIGAESRTGRADTRLPFGWHLHSQTYGTMVAPDGTIYELDNTDERRAALRLFMRTTSDKAPPELKRAEPNTRPQMSTVAADTSELKALRLRGREIAAQLQAGGLEPLVFAVLLDQLSSQINPAIVRSVPTLFNATYSCGDILEQHGARLMRSDGTYDWYGAIAGDNHIHTKSPKYKVDTSTNRCFGLSPNGTPGNDTKGHDPFSLFTILDYNGNRKQAQAAAADLLAPIGSADTTATREATPTPEAPIGSTPEQRRAWADAKRHQRQREQERAAAVQANVIERANIDPRLVNKQGHGTIALVVLMALLDFMGKRDWCRPSVETLATHIGCCERSVQRGLADLEAYEYIVTERKVKPDTGLVWSGGKPLDTPIRTLVSQPIDGIATPQTDDGGVTGEVTENEAKSDYVTHVLVTEYNYTEKVTDKRGAEPTPAPACEPEPVVVAVEGGASFDPGAALAFTDRPYTERTKANITPDERNAGLAAMLAEWREAHSSEIDDQAEPEEDIEQGILFDPPAEDSVRSAPRLSVTSAGLSRNSHHEPSRLLTRAERIAVAGWHKERTTAGYRFVHPDYGITNWHPYPYHAMEEAEQLATAPVSTA